MSTTTRRQPRAHKPAAAPFSTAATKLIEQIQAEARAKLLEDLSSKDAITVLHGFDQDTKRVRATATDIDVYDDRGNEVNLHRTHTEPDSWKNAPHMVGYWHAAKWSGYQVMVDANGIEWKRDLGRMVCDDFGNLVKVAK